MPQFIVGEFRIENIPNLLRVLRLPTTVSRSVLTSKLDLPLRLLTPKTLRSLLGKPRRYPLRHALHPLALFLARAQSTMVLIEMGYVVTYSADASTNECRAGEVRRIGVCRGPLI